MCHAVKNEVVINYKVDIKQRNGRDKMEENDGGGATRE